MNGHGANGHTGDQDVAMEMPADHGSAASSTPVHDSSTQPLLGPNSVLPDRTAELQDKSMIWIPALMPATAPDDLCIDPMDSQR